MKLQMKNIKSNVICVTLCEKQSCNTRCFPKQRIRKVKKVLCVMLSVF